MTLVEGRQTPFAEERVLVPRAEVGPTEVIYPDVFVRVVGRDIHREGSGE